ncbi:M24 family metallopeptidase [Primorskyibacter sp. S187A]|uniref:M24 family metallopeptidase n=1 Tax=Primorskyibacter sp. S187A TaxID=3415130 RepID=UPI003C7E027B
MAQSLPFGLPEYEARLTDVRRMMQARGLECLFVTDPSNMAWLTGYDGWSFYVHQGVIVPMEGAPVWWGRMQDAAGARRTCWMGADDIHGYAENYIQTELRHPMEDLVTCLRARGLSGARLGVEMDNYYFSAKAHAVLAEGIDDVSDATGLVNWCRAVKSEAELAYMHRAARIAERVLDGALDKAAEGVPKNEIVADMLRDAILGADGHWGDYAAIVPLIPSGADAAAPHLTWNGDPLRAGEATTIEIAGCYRRYHVPLCRTFFIGELPEAMIRAEAAVLEGLEAGLDAARAGHQARDVARALNAALRKAGIERTARCGYPIGLSYPPDWGERTISFREEDETVLEPGMCFHFMPGLWMDDWGIAITESIEIMPNGPARPFCNRPRALIRK